jgi:signal transduction histidine kinase
VTITSTAVAGLPVVLADPTQLQQVIMNFITNAVDALSGAIGCIAISVRETVVSPAGLPGFVIGHDLPNGRLVVIEVTNDGCGMRPEAMARIFDPFFTTKSAGAVSACPPRSASCGRMGARSRSPASMVPAHRSRS